MPRYAVVNSNGKIENLTNASIETAALARNFVRITDTTLEVGDRIDTQGVLLSKRQANTNESRQTCRELVRQELRGCDWTQLPDASLNPAKVQAWATYRTALKDNWATAKATTDPLSNMVWPTAPGDATDGL